MPLGNITRGSQPILSSFFTCHMISIRLTLCVTRYSACQFPSASLARLLIKVGADISARDEDGNTPLHLAAMACPSDASLLTVLLENGAHIDAVNSDNETMESLLKQRLHHSLLNPIKYKTLACLAAKALTKYTKKEYYLEQIPRSLIPFVEAH